MEVSDTARDLCLKYLDFIWDKYQGPSVLVDGTLLALPEALKAKFCEATYKNFINRVSIESEVLFVCV